MVRANDPPFQMGQQHIDPERALDINGAQPFAFRKNVQIQERDHQKRIVRGHLLAANSVSLNSVV